jgi:hypothetical protein
MNAKKYLRAACKLEGTVPLFVLCKALYALHWPAMVFRAHYFFVSYSRPIQMWEFI